MGSVLRSAGKYGQHLPMHYKLIAAAVGVIGLVIGLLLALVVYPMGR